MRNSSGQWCDEDDELQAIARNFYVQLYTRDLRVQCQPSQWSFPTLNRSSVNWLNRDVTSSEIKLAVFDMGPHKAPGPDGLPAVFFQNHWSCVGTAISEFVLNVFRTGVVPEQMNTSLICLLPKQHQPTDISQFRPICLSNVVIKIISKVIANRVKRIIGDLVGEWQAAFVPHRQASDNIIVAQELLHTMRTRHHKKHGMIVKIDLEKAYDRIDWYFLTEVLRTVGFGCNLIQVIRSCLDSATLSLLWNGKWLEPFKPERGLRQGDPLSPYLFILCMEVLAQRIQQAVQSKQWTAPLVGRRRVSISHRFLADDLLLFGQASVTQAKVMFGILHTFCGESGQKVNGAKSRIWYAPKTPLSVITTITSEFGVPATSELGKYLGILLLHGRVKQQHF